MSRSSAARSGAAAALASGLLFLTAGIVPASADPCAGTRYVAPAGADAGNDCASSAAPCGTIQHAVDVACDGESVSVAEGEYHEDIVIAHPVHVHGSGLITSTHLTGTGAADVVRILSSSVSWGGITVWNTPGVAGAHIGDAAHPGLRDVVLDNATFRANGIGIILDSTGCPAGNEAWNRFTGVVARDSAADGSADMGTGILLVGGNGKLQILGGRMHGNGGAGLRVDPPAPGAANCRILAVGQEVWNNGLSPASTHHAAYEIHQASDVEIEGNLVFGHTGPTAADDGRVALFDQVSGGLFACNDAHDNDSGVLLGSGTNHVETVSNAFTRHSGTALLVDAGAGAANTAHETLFSLDGTGVRNLGSTAFDAAHCWWGAADGPSGDAPGTGDAVHGPVSTTPFVDHAARPLLVRRPANSGWTPGEAACFDAIQPAVDAAPAGAHVLVGAGLYYEHLTVDKPLSLEGIAGGAGCSPSIVDGYQGTVLHRPVLRVTGTQGVNVADLTLQNAAHGVPCGTDAGDEIGLDIEGAGHSTFTGLCLRGNGITEVRVHGDADGNLLDGLDVDGATTPFDGQACEHVAHQGVLVDGGAACEGGGGASADGTTIAHAKIRDVALGVVVRLASATTVADSDIEAIPSAAWEGGGFAAGVAVHAAAGTTVTRNRIGAAAMTEGIRIEGRTAADCFEAPTDSTGTSIAGNTIEHIVGAAIHLARTGADPGAPAGTSASCNDVHFNGTGFVVDDTGASAGLPASFRDNDLHANLAGMVTSTAAPLDAASNWFGDPSGPSGAGPGTGDSVSANVSFAPFRAAPVTTDGDGDGPSACAGDCDDTNPSVHPGAADVCNGIDDDCDGTVDGGITPPGHPVLVAHRNGGDAVIEWPAVLGADSYDVVRGGLAALEAGAGDFGASGLACLAADTVATSVTDAALPAGGDGVWYLARAANCAGSGGYDDGGGLAHPRDAGIAGSGANCP